MPNGDGTGPAWAKGMSFGCGRRMGFGSANAGTCIRRLPADERKRLLEERKAEIEGELKVIEASKD